MIRFLAAWATAVARGATCKTEADRLDNTHFVGRLALYQYLNMDQVVERALTALRGIRDSA